MTYYEFELKYDELRKELFNCNSEWDWEIIEEQMSELECNYPSFYEEYKKNK